MISTLTETNQVTVPAEIVKEMQLELGSRFEWTLGERPGTIVVEVLPSVRQLLDRVRELGTTLDPRIMDELIKERIREDVEEYG